MLEWRTAPAPSARRNARRWPSLTSRRSSSTCPAAASPAPGARAGRAVIAPVMVSPVRSASSRASAQVASFLMLRPMPDSLKGRNPLSVSTLRQFKGPRNAGRAGAASRSEILERGGPGAPRPALSPVWSAFLPRRPFLAASDRAGSNRCRGGFETGIIRETSQARRFSGATVCDSLTWQCGSTGPASSPLKTWQARSAPD